MLAPLLDANTFLLTNYHFYNKKKIKLYKACVVIDLYNI